MSKTINKSNKPDTPKLIDTYFNDVIKYQNQFGEKTAVYIQVGDFYEIYSAEFPDGTTIGILNQISDICNLTISQKKVCLGLSSDAKVFMGGFPIYMLDKFINIPVDEHGWTVIVIKQDEACSGTTRSIEGIYSPGTNMRTSDESNTIVLAVIEKVRSRINKNQTSIYIGLSSLDSITGNTTVYETFSIDQNTVLSYDEIQKFISAKNPREVLIETSDPDLSESDLINALNLNGRPYRFNFITYGKPEKSIDTQNKFFSKLYPHKLKISVIDYLGLQYKEYGRLSLMLLLKYILDHSTIMLNKIAPPEVWEINTQLILANNCLEQLNIIDNRFNSREISLIRILDNTSTILGRRGFRNRLLNPIRDSDILRQRYAEITEFMDFKDGKPNRNLYLEIENELKSIRDLERLHRRIAMNTITPNEISSLVISYKAIIELYNKLKIKNSPIIKSFLPQKEYWCKMLEAYELLEKSFDFDKTGFTTLEKVDKNFFRKGCNTKLDQHQNRIDHSLNIFKEFSNWMDEIIGERDTTLITEGFNITNKIFKKVVRYDFNELFQHHLYLTRNRYDNFNRKINELMRDGINDVTISVYDSNTEQNINYKINFKSIHTEKKNRATTDVVILLHNPALIKNNTTHHKADTQQHASLFEEHNHKLRVEMDYLKSTVISYYKEFIQDFSDNYIGFLREITKFVIQVDIVKAGAKMAIENSYVAPQIIDDDDDDKDADADADNDDDEEKEDNQARAIDEEGQYVISTGSFLTFKGIRHPIIEHINQKIEYVDNDISLGQDNLDGILLFGVNASGKSSLMKAIGINLILAQAGFFVACKEMKYKPFEYLFTRIWNNDNIFKGQSTFEVEISELKSIIKHAGNKSLVLGDELCAGTETVSASAIVTAGIKKLSKKRAKFIFATHLHFLADSQHLIKLDNVRNYHLSVLFDKANQRLIYDRKLKEGSGPSTYGLEVCKAMGLDDDFLQDALAIRNEITNETLGSFLSNKQSKYNQNVRIDTCQVCNSPGEDVHHIHFQCTADNNGKIGSIDKNRESNLVVLCKKCHNSVHHPRGTLKINGYVETSTGIELHYSQRNIDKISKY
jgi:DNA mismatch repair protein MutS